MPLTKPGGGGAGGGSGGGGGGDGYGDWVEIASLTGAISSIAVAVALSTGEAIDNYEEAYIHIAANDTNDQRSVSVRFRASDIPDTALLLGGLLVSFPGYNTDEGSICIRRNTDGTTLTLDPHGSVIGFPTTSTTTIWARTFSAPVQLSGGAKKKVLGKPELL